MRIQSWSNKAVLLNLWIACLSCGSAFSGEDDLEKNIRRSIEKAKTLLGWEKRAVSPLHFSGIEMLEIVQTASVIFPEGKVSIPPSYAKYKIKDGCLKIAFYHDIARKGAEDSFLRNLVSTNDHLDLRLSGFTLKEERYSGGYTYVRTVGKASTPVEIIFGYGNIIVHARSEISEKQPMSHPHDIADIVEKIARIAVKIRDKWSIRLDIGEAKLILAWERRKTGASVFDEADAASIVQQFTAAFPKAAPYTAPGRLAKAAYTCLDDGFEAFFYHGKTRNDTENSFLRGMSATSMTLDLRLGGFSLRNGYLGDYSYINTAYKDLRPVEVFFGYGNIIVYLRSEALSRAFKGPAPDLIAISEKISGIIKSVAEAKTGDGQTPGGPPAPAKADVADSAQNTGQGSDVAAPQPTDGSAGNPDVNQSAPKSPPDSRAGKREEAASTPHGPADGDKAPDNTAPSSE